MIKTSLVIFYTVLFAILTTQTHAQQTAENTAEKLIEFIKNRPQEKIYVHLDKPFYAISDNIWFKVYTVDAVDHLPRKAALVYLELIDQNNEIVARRNVQIVEGGGFGDINIPELSLPAGEYVLRAYTSYMRNFDPDYFFYKKIQLLDGTEEDRLADEENASLDINFFPEGGEMVANQVNFVAFKIEGVFNTDDVINGQVTDDTGKVITEFRTEKFGMGLFPLRPEKNRQYTAQVNYRGRDYNFPLPTTLENGFGLSIRNTGSNLVLVARHSDQQNMDGAYVIAHQRGRILGVVKSNGKPMIRSAFKMGQLPAGVISFTLFDANGTPKRERISFVENRQAAIKPINISTDAETYGSRQKIALDLTKDQSSFEGNGSVSVTNINIVAPDSRTSHLLSYLLLSSDIKGNIENPAYYFDTTNTERRKHLDLLMLTQGWRRFKWEDVLAEEQSLFRYPYEKGFTIEGKLVDYNFRKKAVAGEVKLNIMEDLLATQTVVSNDSGYFFIPDLMIGDTATVVLQAKKVNKKKKVTDNDNIFISRIERETPEVSLPDFVKTQKFEEKPVEVESYVEAYSKIVAIDSAFRLQDGIYLLGEFEVSSTKTTTAIDNPFKQADILYGTPSKRMVIDSMARILPSNRILDILRSTSGVLVSGSFPNQTVRIRGISSVSSGTTPLILVDGVYTSLEVLNSIPVAEVSYIDVIKGPDAAIFGAQGANGAIAVYTRTESRQERKGPRVGIADFKFPGFTVPREFYTPDYSKKSDKHKKPDYRTTLFWDPNINFSSDQP
ncbi:MAG: Plug domain-containing protein, partial [Cyclobacteriaceae bacterium]